MESQRVVVSTLTIEQQVLLHQFNEAIMHADEAKLIEVIDQLNAIPDEYSPARVIALQGNAEAIDRIFKAAREKVAINMSNARQTLLEAYHADYIASVERFKRGETNQFVSEPFVFNSDAYEKSYLILSACIYRNAIWGFAVGNNVKQVQRMLEECNQKIMYVQAVAGYFKGGFFEEMIALCKVYVEKVQGNDDDYKNHPFYLSALKMLTEIGKFDLVSSLLPKNVRFKLVNRLSDGLHYNAQYDDYDYDEQEAALYKENQKRIDIENAKTLAGYALLKDIYQHYYDAGYRDKLEELIVDGGNQLVNFGAAAAEPFSCFIIKMLALFNKVEVISKLLAGIDSNAFLKFSKIAIEGYSQSGQCEFERKKLEHVNYILLHSSKYAGEQKEDIFKLLSQIEGIDLRKNLMIDCIYKRSHLGEILWEKNYNESTPSLKRGVLKDIVHALIDCGMDVGKLPGFEEFSQRGLLSAFGLYNYPSKTRIFPLAASSAGNFQISMLPNKQDADSDVELNMKIFS